MKTVELFLAVGLYTSGILGLEIVLADKWLWTASPAHAFGLVIFIAIDIILLLAIWNGTTLWKIGALIISIIQLGLMLADLIGGHPSGISQDTFRNYLLNDIQFVGLLLVQIVTFG